MPRQGRAGFTLIEMMISLTLLAIVLGGLTTVMVGMQRGYTRQRETARSEDALRNAELTISSILRYAGANPRNLTGAGAPRIDPFGPPFDSLRVVADFNPADADVARSAGECAGLCPERHPLRPLAGRCGGGPGGLAGANRGFPVRFQRHHSGHQR